MSDAQPPLWSPETDDTLVCVAAFPETHDVMSFVLAAAPVRRFSYQPGQFLTLELDINGETVNRC